MKKIFLISILLVFFLLEAVNSFYSKSEKRNYKLINSDDLNVVKSDSSYITQLTGNVDFYYGNVHLLADKAIIFEKKELVKLMGDVNIVDDSLDIKSKYAEYDKKNEIFTLKDSALIVENHRDGTYRSFFADYITYNRNEQVVKADKNVRAYDERESIYATCGYSQYNLKESEGFMTKNPYLKVVSNDSISFSANKVEYFDNYKKIVATFKVVISSDYFYAMSDFLIYYSEMEKAILLGLPRVYSDFGDATANEIRLQLENQKLRKANLKDSCYIVFSETEVGEKFNWVKSDFMTLNYANELLDECFAFDNVKSYVYSKGNKKKERLINKMDGEKLYLKFNEKNNIEKIIMTEKVKGSYKFIQ